MPCPSQHPGAILVAELGGSIQARGDGPGRGAAFTVTIPPPQVSR